mmetsp:Transcript_32826/g.88113  ORF Transcript_32826/g.88113 Transcript_32826/m.88113 type:complete len:310 (+) Transcript_32826:1164-2093(+)
MHNRQCGKGVPTPAFFESCAGSDDHCSQPVFVVPPKWNVQVTRLRERVLNVKSAEVAADEILKNLRAGHVTPSMADRDDFRTPLEIFSVEGKELRHKRGNGSVECPTLDAPHCNVNAATVQEVVVSMEVWQFGRGHLKEVERQEQERPGRNVSLLRSTQMVTFGPKLDQDAKFDNSRMKGSVRTSKSRFPESHRVVDGQVHFNFITVPKKQERHPRPLDNAQDLEDARRLEMPPHLEQRLDLRVALSKAPVRIHRFNTVDDNIHIGLLAPKAICTATKRGHDPFLEREVLVDETVHGSNAGVDARFSVS